MHTKIEVIEIARDLSIWKGVKIKIYYFYFLNLNI